MTSKISAVIITGCTSGAAHSVLFRPAVDFVIENIAEAGVTNALLTDTIEGIGAFGKISVTNGNTDVAEFVDQQNGDILIVCGDMPLLEPETIKRARMLHITCKNDITAIKSERQKACGLWCKKEIFLDLYGKGLPLRPDVYEQTPVPRSACCFPSHENELYRANDKLSLYKINISLREKMIRRAAQNGIEIVDPSGVTIAADAKIGEGTIIHKGTIIKTGCEIGENCEIGPDTVLDHCKVGSGAMINASQAEFSTIGDGTKIGPYSHIRPNSNLGSNVKIGNFVEVKNSNIDDKTSVAHLTYIGDCDCGKNVNWGCGCVTVNYDGKGKYRTVVGDNAFVGCNSNLVAPVTVEKNTYIAAGSTITHTVPEDALAIARARQVNKEGWNKKNIK